MANKNERHAENAFGNWYVDTTCICCGLCADAAPTVFRISSEGGQNIVFKQPATATELQESTWAKEACPVDAIGDDDE